jgi:hypothetical protein
MTPKWAGVGDSAGASNSSLSGEAVVVDLGEGRYLFALLKGYTEFTGRLAFLPLSPEAAQQGRRTPRSTTSSKRLRASTELPRELYPAAGHLRRHQ